MKDHNDNTFKILKETNNYPTRELKATWTLELADDIRRIYNAGFDRIKGTEHLEEYDLSMGKYT
jgi:hypothetical protein